MIGFAQSMVYERFDDPAFADISRVRNIRNALQLRFEHLQLRDPSPHGQHVARGDIVRMAARPIGTLGQLHQFANVLDGQSKLACMTYERKSLQATGGVASLIARRALGRFDQLHLFIVSDRRNFHAGPLGKLADRIELECSTHACTDPHLIGHGVRQQVSKAHDHAH